MDWLSSLLNIQSSIQAIIIVALICGIGLWLGKIRLGGISLRVLPLCSSLAYSWVVCIWR